MTSASGMETEDLVPWIKIPVPEQVPVAFEGYADTDPVKLWYWDTGGDGEVVVLNHPWSQSSECWKYQQPFFAKQGYRVIAWSRRGAYKTEVGPLDNLGTSAGDQKMLLDYLGIEKCHMVGCAAGGVTSINFALENPERLYSVVLSGSILLPDEQEYRDMFARTSLPPGHNTTGAFREIGASYRGANPEGVAAWSELEHRAVPNGAFRDQPWGSEPVTWVRMEQLQVPVLLMAGDAEHGSNAATQRLFANHLPNRELAVIDEAGHAAYWEQPEVFNATVLDFITRHKGGASIPPTPAPQSTDLPHPGLRPNRARNSMPEVITGPVEVWKKAPVPEPVPFTEGYADTSPVKIWYWDTGPGSNGETVAFAHPWSQSSECYKRYQMPVFFRAGYRVISWSWRGFYKTEKGPMDDMGSTADDLHKLMAFLGVDKFHLVGCAAGGVTAVAYALLHEDRLNSVVLSGSILLPSDPEYAEFRGNLAAAPPGETANVPVEYREVGACYRAGNPEGLAEWQRMEHEAHPDGWFRDQPWGADRNNAAFEKLTLPVLLQTGAAEMGIPASLQRMFKPHFKNSEIRVIREAGHNPYWEQPEVFNASVLDFIGRHGAKG